MPVADCLADLIDAAKRLADRFASNAATIDCAGAFPTAEFADLKRTGLLTAPFPIGLGGAAVGMTSNEPASRGTTAGLLRLLEEVGRGNLAVGRLWEGHVNAVLLIRQFARADQLEAYAAAARAGQVFGVWNTQTAGGLCCSDVGADGRVELTGSKTFASGAGQIARPIVTAKRPDGSWQMIVFPADQLEMRVDPTSWNPLGMKASASYHVYFDRVRLPAREWLLGASGDYYREPWFSSGAIRFAAVQLGGARALLDATVESLRSWGRTGDPYQRARIGSMAIAVESGRQWLQAAAAVADQVDDGADRHTIGRAITHAQMTRTALEAICQDVLRLAEQCVGARGLLAPHPIERIGRDLTIYLRQPGPDSALAQVGQAWLERDLASFYPDLNPPPRHPDHATP